jgi:hypothetical protein
VYRDKASLQKDLAARSRSVMAGQRCRAWQRLALARRFRLMNQRFTGAGTECL